MKTATVFNIQKMSIHDGPGIRTTVFFKGCPLRCIWCSNPESQRMGKEIACFEARCVSCGYCSQVCPKEIIENHTPFNIMNRNACNLCGNCVKECCTNSKKLIGEDYDVDKLLKEILKDKTFYDSSGGGVTFSGGEPLLQANFLLDILSACKENGIHTAIETTAYAERELLCEIVGQLDLIFVDIKHMNPNEHKKLTGVSNEKILNNIAFMSQNHDNIIVRIPVIPGVNDSKENIKHTADFVAACGIKKLELLPYHNLGEIKYGQLGMKYELSSLQAPSNETMEDFVHIAREAIAGRSTEVRVENSINE